MEQSNLNVTLDNQKGAKIVSNYYSNVWKKFIDFFIGFIGYFLLFFSILNSKKVENFSTVVKLLIITILVIIAIFLIIFLRKKRKFISIGIISTLSLIIVLFILVGLVMSSGFNGLSAGFM